ncbi:hypothetical protein DFQ15_11196 [Xylophilus ampelinus]|uniref:Uncharacterized protein n=1 Tax=Xylophilus ampelinus TaxID=54067 RepID=A0A318SL35_9BURK|nr:hypothetical protein DFQ15_11196 [Xylophilus ampelinus]
MTEKMELHPRSAFGASPFRGRTRRPGKAGSTGSLVSGCAGIRPCAFNNNMLKN